MANIIKFPSGDESIAEGVVDENEIEEVNEIKELLDAIDVEDVEDILIVTRDKNGEISATANNLVGSKLIWMLERVKHTVMLMEDENI